ncbi:MAG: hypothetical protein KME42_13445 [Tildeniella nuda ZEHNDER 1965/U140]|jgi:outer membrane lipoprotein-sorting protein|nr:hypothetical protein [Tildeniella nuda ZEHNDER 1965/U140]
MKFFFRTVAAVSVAVLLSGKSSALSAAAFRSQTHLDRLQMQTDVSLSQQVISVLPQETRRISQVDSKPDLLLLSKVITGFLKSDDYQTQSTMNVNAVIGNTTVTSDAQIQTTAQFPNKFRTEVLFAKPGTKTQIKTLIVSDGKLVWVYRADLKQYAIFNYEKFDQLEDSYWIGFATTMFAQTPLEVKTAVAKGALSDTNLLQEIGLALSDLKGGTRTVDSQTFYAYEYNAAKQGFLMSAFIEPDSAVLKQLRIVGKYLDSDISMVERILSRVAIAPVSTNTFTFTPPKGTKKVKALVLGPL